MKTISIVLTKYSNFMSNLMYLLSGGGYTHVSLSLGDAKDSMYSFNYKGFCIDTLEKYRRHGVKKSICYHLQVSEAVYSALRNHIQHFIDHREDFSYTKLGVVLCLFRIPFTRKNHYFCSQFVAETLARAGAIKLKRRPCLYLPNHLRKEIAYSLQLQSIQYNPV